jgi:hypothetical protein
MTKHVRFGWWAAVGLLLGCFLALELSGLRAQNGEKTKAPKWVHALDLKCREFGKADFDKAKQFGIEVFKDEATDNNIYLSQEGALGIVPAKAVNASKKKPTWLADLDLKCRKGKDEDFDKAEEFGVECFKDEATDNLVYLCQTGAIAVIPAKADLKVASPKKPTWLYALDLKCRKGREEDFDKATVFGVEVFKDENTGNLVYISQKGYVAVVRAGKIDAPVEKPKKPKWSHALELKARKAGQEDFDKAEVFGVEIFKDENSGNLIYISHEGSIAVIPAKADLKVEKPKKPKWTHALDLKYRKGGQAEFDDKMQYGVEIFKDENTGNLVYISQTGAVSVIAAKAK